MQGLDPRAAEIAMEQMRRMTPEQIQQLTRSMGNMNPAFMQQAMSQMNNMSSSDWDRAKEQINNMQPDDLTKHATDASAYLSSQQQYVLNASIQLKNEGNKLHASGSYQQAIEKYARAKSNVTDFNTPEAKDLRKACLLNLSSCYLNLEKYDECIEECNNVLAVEADSLKALYRRGQAYSGRKAYAKAVKDLRKAVRLSDSDPNQQKLIKEKLAFAEEKLEETGAFVSSTSSTGPPVSSVIIEEIEDEPEPSKPAAAAEQPSSSTASTSMPFIPSIPAMDPAMVRSATEMMKNPEMAKQINSMMGTMSDEQLAAMSKQMGMPVTRDMLKTAQEQMGKMEPEQMKAMLNAMDGKIPAGGFPPAPGVPAMQDPEAMQKAAEMMQQNPSMVKMAADMMSKMSPEQINQMCAQAGGNLPVSPEIAKQAAEELSKMSPEQVAQATKLAAAMRGPGSSTSGTSTGTSSGTGTNSATVSSTVSQPAAAAAGDFAAMAQMMQNMDADQLSTMGQMAGAGGITPEMAKAAADMMSKMSPEDLERMSKMAMGAGFPGAPGAAAGMPPSAAGMSQAAMAQMAAQMDPAMMESAVGMMRNMDDESLVSMMLSSGMCSDREQAAVMAKQMKGMSDTQMKVMVKAASTVQAVSLKVQQAKAYVMQHKLLVLSIVVVLVALLLSTFGYI